MMTPQVFRRKPSYGNEKPLPPLPPLPPRSDRLAPPTSPGSPPVPVEDRKVLQKWLNWAEDEVHPPRSQPVRHRQTPNPYKPLSRASDTSAPWAGLHSSRGKTGRHERNEDGPLTSEETADIPPALGLPVKRIARVQDNPPLHQPLHVSVDQLRQNGFETGEPVKAVRLRSVNPGEAKLVDVLPRNATRRNRRNPEKPLRAVQSTPSFRTRPFR